MRSIPGWCVALAALTLGSVHAQSKDKPQTLDAHVEATTSSSGLTTAVLGRKGEKGEPLFLFCISHEKLPTPVTTSTPTLTRKLDVITASTSGAGHSPRKASG